MVTTRRNINELQESSIKISIIVPAYKEKANLKPLVERLCAAMGDKMTQAAEIIVVDDNSKDGSQEVVEELGKTWPVRIITRTLERGLSSAVLRGFKEAKGELLLCMDADLQHPPEKVPDMFKVLKQEEFVIGTRYASGHLKVDKDWPLYRQIISTGARQLARPLTALSDPMTGFFGIQKSVLARGKDISPIGFKIAMELYVKCEVVQHGEVPIDFGVRVAGESKLSSKVIYNYLVHLGELYMYKFPFVFVFMVLILLVLLGGTFLVFLKRLSG